MEDFRFSCRVNRLRAVRLVGIIIPETEASVAGGVSRYREQPRILHQIQKEEERIMKSDVIHVDHLGSGSAEAQETTLRFAQAGNLDAHEALRLQLITEEMLNLVRLVTGENDMSFWIEYEGGKYLLHLSTRTVMDMEKRARLISVSSTRKNEAACSLMGKLRDTFEKAMLAAGPSRVENVPEELTYDVYFSDSDQEWDKYESSVLRKLADDLRIRIRGRQVELIVGKRFLF